VDTDIVQERLMAALAGFFGALALLLASVGLYGVISISSRRTRRLVFNGAGAPRASVFRVVMGDAALLVGIGAAIGVGAAVGLSGLVRSLLYGISPQDPTTLAGAVVALFVVAMAAVVTPVRRALRIHPSEALRYE
jgi:ABC-type antimicrobial peptide transport system permease subunit